MRKILFTIALYVCVGFSLVPSVTHAIPSVTFLDTAADDSVVVSWQGWPAAVSISQGAFLQVFTTPGTISLPESNGFITFTAQTNTPIVLSADLFIPGLLDNVTGGLYFFESPSGPISDFLTLAGTGIATDLRTLLVNSLTVVFDSEPDPPVHAVTCDPSQFNTCVGPEPHDMTFIQGVGVSNVGVPTPFDIANIWQVGMQSDVDPPPFGARTCDDCPARCRPCRTGTKEAPPRLIE